MKTIKTYVCGCGEDFYEDDKQCINCGVYVQPERFRDVEVVEIKENLSMLEKYKGLSESLELPRTIKNRLANFIHFEESRLKKEFKIAIDVQNMRNLQIAEGAVYDFKELLCDRIEGKKNNRYSEKSNDWNDGFTAGLQGAINTLNGFDEVVEKNHE